jgi:hypothetical protein
VALTTTAPDPLLDLAAYVGQRSATFRFDIVDALTGYRTTITPRADRVPTLTHNTSNTIVRTITGLYLNPRDTALFNAITSRLQVFMIIRDRDPYPLGTYVPATWLRFPRAGLEQTSVTTFYDEGVIVDQQLDTSFGTPPSTDENVSLALTRLLTPLPVNFTIEPTSFTTNGSWAVGTRRGFVVEQLALDGDYLSPWFDHENVMRFIRSFDPATALPTFDLDAGNRVIRDRITESDTLIDAPNRFVVVGNGVSTLESNVPIIGTFDVPSSAPHSIVNRGFVIPDVSNRQISTTAQAEAIARNLATRQSIIEEVELVTPPDPRHDSYDVLRWRGVNWLEVSWSLPLAEGALMQHTARRIYT